MIVVYYHTSAEYATDYNLIIQNLLEGYDPGTEETLVVTSGDSIIAANREGLAGRTSTTCRCCAASGRTPTAAR